MRPALVSAALAAALQCAGSVVYAADAPSAGTAGAVATGSTAPGNAASFQNVLHLLDYVAVDYAGAVENGKVKSESEYKENLEFATRAADLTKALPPGPASPA